MADLVFPKASDSILDEINRIREKAKQNVISDAIATKYT